MNKKFKLALLVASSFCATGVMASCGIKPQPDPETTPVVDVKVESVTIDKTELEMHISDTYQLNPTVLPENATNKALTYNSLRPTIATVDASGKITALAEGTTVVSVVSQNNAAARAELIVTVTKLVVGVNEVKLDVESLNLLVGQGHDLVATVLPENATDKSVTFSSLDSDIASVDKDGKVTAVAAGTTYIFCSANDGSGKQAKVKVVVTESHVAVTSVSVGSVKNITLEPNAEQTIQVTVLPENATDKSVTFTSTQPEVVSVTAEGKIKALREGSSSIIVQSVDNPSKIDTLNVVVATTVTHVTGVTISETSKTVEENADSFKLTATVAPEGADNKAVSWSSSNPAVAFVDGEGNVTLAKAGEAVITVTTADGGHEAYCTVTVTKTDIDSLTMSEETILFEVTSTPETDKKEHQLSAVIAPSTATYKEVAWSSSNIEVATVDQTGKVTKGTAMGVATISAVHKNSGLVATCVVTVAPQAVTKIELNQTAISFQEGFEDESGVRQLSESVTPATAPNTGVKWESSNLDVVTVDQTGKVTLVGYGTDGKAVITCTSLQNPTVSASCSVTVAKANEYSLALPVQTSKAYSSFLSNRGAKINPLEEFYVKNKTLQVGDDNPINLTPRLAVYKGKTPVDQSNWAFPYDIKVEKKVGDDYVAATAAEAEIVSALTCDIQFKADAIDSYFRVTVIPGGLSEAKKVLDDAKAVYELHVIDGYNVTNEYELSYLDDMNDSDMFDTKIHGDQGNGPKYETFKTEHNIDKDLHPNAVILQDDMMITPEHIPSAFFYTAEDAAKGNWTENEKAKSLGSLKDRTYFYSHRHLDKTVTLEGNYFSTDWSKIPVVRRPDCQMEDADNKVNSHSAFMRTYIGETDVQNLNIIGNAHAAQTDAQNYAMGGLIAFKYTGDSKGMVVDNIVEHACYISFMSEGGFTDNINSLPAYYRNMKCFDNYNCFLYNWGGKMVIENSFFEGCGGPVMIQDHTGIDVDEGEVYDEIKADIGQFAVYGHKPETTFIDCQFNNYVIGTEAWFNSFGAAALSQTIKMFSDLLKSHASSNGLTFLFDENKVGTTYTESAEAGKDCMMNFIVLNKSSAAESLTTVPVDGEVKFINNGVVTDNFNYMNPTSMTAPTQEEKVRFGQEAIKYNAFRGLNNLGAPVFETAGGPIGFYAADKEHPETGALCNMTNVAAAYSPELATAIGQFIPGYDQAYALDHKDDIPAESFNANGYLAMYYNGMALVLGAGHYGM